MKPAIFALSLSAILFLISCDPGSPDMAIENTLEEFADAIEDQDLEEAREFLDADRIDNDEEQAYEETLAAITKFSVDVEEVDATGDRAKVKLSFEYVKNGHEYKSTETYKMKLDEGKWKIPDDLLIDILTGEENEDDESGNPADNPVQEEDSGALEKTRQNLTASRIKLLGQAIQVYILDHNRIGSPKCSNMQELWDILVTQEYLVNREVITDGWGVVFIWESDMTLGSKGYTLTSFGSDAISGPSPNIEGIAVKYEEDIILSNGSWVQKPAGY